MSSILIGVDRSPRSEDAIAFAEHLAAVSTAHVVVACAFPYNDGIRQGSDPTYRKALADEAQETAALMRDKLLGRVDESRMRIRIAANPSPAHALHDLAEADRAELVVVGSSHTGHLGRVAPGSTAERLLHGAPCAVAVVPYGYRTRTAQPIRRIGVAYDGSAEATDAVAAAVELARAFGAELELIGVVSGSIYAASGMMGGAVYAPPAADLERDVQEDLDAVLASLPADITAECVCLAGDPAEVLGARSAGLDLMLAGSRGYGPLRSVLVGGVSGRLIRTAQCPVIVVPRGAETPLANLFASAEASVA